MKRILFSILFILFSSSVYSASWCVYGFCDNTCKAAYFKSYPSVSNCTYTDNGSSMSISCTSGSGSTSANVTCTTPPPAYTPPPPTPTPAPTPQPKCDAINGKSFYGFQKGNSPEGCINGCSTSSSQCGYVPPLTVETTLTCKYTVNGIPCSPSAPQVSVGNPPAPKETQPPECPNYYIGKSDAKICMNPPPMPTWTPVDPTPPPKAPTPFPTDANGNPVLKPDGSSGSEGNPSASGGGGGGGSGGTGTGGGTSPGPAGSPNPNQSPSPNGTPGPSGSPSPSSTPSSGDVPDLPDKLYSSKEKRSFVDVLNKHSNIMAKSSIVTAASGYFKISVSGSCPKWVIPSVMGMPSIIIDQFCNSTAYGLYAIIKIVLLIGCSIIAFRIAVLD